MLRGVSFYRKDPPEGFVTYLDYEGALLLPKKVPKSSCCFTSGITPSHLNLLLSIIYSLS